MSLLTKSIQFILNNIPSILLIIALIISFWQLSSNRKHRNSLQKINIFIANIMLFPIGIGGLWAFVMHAFFPTFISTLMGWPSSPFQFEVAIANFSLGLAGIFSYNASKGFRIATTLFVTCFYWGIAIGHARQMLIQHNFYTNIIIPLLLIILLIIYNSRAKHVFMTKN